MKRYWTSDLHFFHKTIIEHANRPFANTEEMNTVLVDNINSVVTNNDELYILGDLSFGKPQQTLEIVQVLKGKKHLVLGNHDKELKRKKDIFLPYFEFIGDYLEVKEQDNTCKGGSRLIVMCHYPMVSWNKAHWGSYMLHGHCHGNLNHLNASTTRYDVGVDNNNYMPILYDDIRLVMDKKTFIPVDHHTKEISE